MTTALRRLLACLFVLFSREAIAGNDAAVAVVQGYTIDSWRSADGNALGAVRALTLDADGYLWIGADTGLFRFDGYRFTPVATLDAGSAARYPVRALHVARDKSLWIGLGDGHGIAHLRATQVVQLLGGGVVEGVSGGVSSIAEDADGTLWAGHDNGLLRRVGDKWLPVGANEGWSGARVYDLQVEGRRLFVGTAAGLFVRPDGGVFTAVEGAERDTVRASLHDSTGRLWITDPLHGLREPAGSRGQSARQLAARGSKLLRDGRGNLWLATIGQGLWRVVRDGQVVTERLTFQNGLLTDGIWALSEDRHGNIWVGTHEGLNRLTPHSLQPVTGLGITSSVAGGQNGVVWTASSEGLIRFDAPRLDRSPRTTIPLEGIRTIEVDSSGRVWVSTASGLLCYERGRFSPVVTASGQHLNDVSAMTAGPHESMVVADARLGLLETRAGRLRPYPLPDGFRLGPVSALHLDRHGALWIAQQSGHLASLAPDGRVTTFDGAPEALPRRITSIQEGPSGIWVTGSMGLSRIADGRMLTLGGKQGLPLQTTSGVAETADGTLWVAIPSKGLGRLSVAEFARAARNQKDPPHLRIFDTTDGMAGMPTVLDNRTTTTSSDGRLWFVTGRGLTVIDQSAIHPSRGSGPVRIEGAVADDHLFPVQSDLALPAATSRIRIDYTAVNLSDAEHIRFRYRLEGFDNEWIEAGASRQAFYTNLKPGPYRFFVQAQDGEGEWRTEPAGWPFSVAPRVYQTKTFYALTLLGLLATLGVVWQSRVRAMRHDFAIVTKERARLSREIHDTLLQGMVGVALQIDIVAKTLSRFRPSTDAAGAQEVSHDGSSVAATQLTAIRRQVEDVIVDARRSIWNMRANTQDKLDLITALEAAGARATAGSNIRFRLDVSGRPSVCPGQVESELVRIAEEALANAVRHAHAGRVSIDLMYDVELLVLRVTDDGTGFDTSREIAKGHIGLLTMRERAEQLGAQFELITRLGAGTQVVTSLPRAVAH